MIKLNIVLLALPTVIRRGGKAMKRPFLYLIILTFLLFPVSAIRPQEKVSFLSFEASPGMQIPFGASADNFSTCGFGIIGVKYKPPITVPLYIGTEIGQSVDTTYTNSFWTFPLLAVDPSGNAGVKNTNVKAG